MAEVAIYTDGSALGNPGAGGYGVVLLSGERRKELSQGYKLTTNNRMELLAAIKGLEALKKDGCDVTIYSDSKYVVDAVELGWLWNWVRTGFKGKKNSDLWRAFIPLYRTHNVKFVWVKGHSNNKENERCDRLAVAAASSKELLEDSGYTSNSELPIIIISV